LEVGVGARVEEHEGDLLVALLAGDEEGGQAVLVDRVDVRRLLQKFLDDGYVIAAGSHLKWAFAKVNLGSML
jgi:hypothetical protein